jgi:hypothetical protein
MDNFDQLLVSCQDLGCRESAVFFAQKLLNMRGNQIQDRYRLASILFQQRDYRSALDVLKQSKTMTLQCKLLAAQCLVYHKTDLIGIPSHSRIVDRVERMGSGVIYDR